MIGISMYFAGLYCTKAKVDLECEIARVKEREARKRNDNSYYQAQLARMIAKHSKYCDGCRCCTDRPIE